MPTEPDRSAAWELRHRYHSTAGKVRWDQFGEPAADPVVLLLHGTPFSSYVWRGVARALAAQHRVYVWDMPGYGESEKFDGQEVSLAVQGAVFAELLGQSGHARGAGGPVAGGAGPARVLPPDRAGRPALHR